MSFSPKINNAPIYTPMQSSRYGMNQTESPWQKYFQQINNSLNVGNNYGNPSVALNSDFNFNVGIPSPITTSGFISEKWEIQAPVGTTFEVKQETYPAANSDQTGSTTYLNVNVSAYTGPGDGTDFYIYQRQTGAEFLRRYQNRNLSVSIGAINNNTTQLNLQGQVFVYYDTSSQTYSSSVANVNTTTLFYAATIPVPSLIGKTIGSSCYVEFRVAIMPVVPFGGQLDFNLNYIKAEMADTATTLYVDHALERTRIDNS